MGLWLIGGYKLVKAAFLIAAGVYVARLRPETATIRLGRVVGRLHLNPDGPAVRKAAAVLAGLDQVHLEWIGAGVVLYGLLYVAQGVGLLLQRRWAEHLVVVTTGFLIPWEAYETARRVTPARAAVLVLNLAVVAYLLARRYAEHQERRGVKERPG